VKLLIIDKKIVIFGVGNQFRQDDGIGLRILEKISENPIILKNTDYIFEISMGVFEIEKLLKLHNNIDLAIFIDAVSSKKVQAGTVLILTLDDLPGDKTDLCTTTHGITLSDILQMIKEIHPEALPKEIIILGIVVPNIGYGQYLSQTAIKAIPVVERLIMDIILNKPLISKTYSIKE